MGKNQFELTDRLNAELGELLAMTVHFLVTLATLFLENQNLVTLNVRNYLRLHPRTCQIRLAQLYAGAIVKEHNRIKLDLFALGSLHPVNVHRLIFPNLKLLPFDFNNRHHSHEFFKDAKIRKKIQNR